MKAKIGNLFVENELKTVKLHLTYLSETSLFTLSGSETSYKQQNIKYFGVLENV